MIGKPVGKIPLTRPRRCGDNIKTDLREIECYGMAWIQMTQNRV